VLHDWNDEDAVRILRTVRRAMDGPRTVLLVERLLDGDASAEAALSDINMMVMNGGRERTLESFARCSLDRLRLEPRVADRCARIPDRSGQLRATRRTIGGWRSPSRSSARCASESHM